MSGTLLLISRVPEDMAFATSVAQTCGLTLRSLPDATQVGEIVSSESVAAMICDTSTEELYRSLEASIQNSVGLFSDRISANAIHFLSSKDLESVKYLVESPLFGHFVLRNYDDPVVAGQHYGRIVKATLSERAFGLERLLAPGTKIQNVKLKVSTQKQQAVEAIKNFLLQAKFQTRMASVIANAVDELLMNAIFDAPVDAIGKHTLNTTPRTHSFPLDGPNAVEMNIGFDGQYVAISAVDHFGSIDKAKLLAHVSKIYTEEEYRVKTTVAGAGIGLATVFRSGGSFFFVSESRVRTEVTVFFKRTESFRLFKDQFRFISTQFYF